jgi:hypothetical protein
VLFLGVGGADLSSPGPTLSLTKQALKSYRDLNAAKFAVITEMETNLEVQVFDDEWERLEENRPEGWRGRYAEFGAVERFVPLIFAALYAAVFISSMLP